MKYRNCADYPEWLHEYEQGQKESLEEDAACMLRKQGELTGDPMGDYKKAAEMALALKYR